jgi:ubiquinone/menaquinone biosynthesis C-methylase UbiE
MLLGSSFAGSPRRSSHGFRGAERATEQRLGEGPYQRITETILDIHERVIDRLDPQPGVKWLDLACGTGAVAERAAQRGADVTGVDLAPALLETAKERAQEQGLDIDYRVGDCERLELEDGAFDVLTSTCGVMFSPDHQAAAGEIARVVKPGGRIALANWTTHAKRWLRSSGS